MIRKGTLVFLAALVLLSAFASCKKDSGKGSVYLLNFKAEVDKEYQEVAAAFTKETGIPVKVETSAGGTYETTLRARIESRTPATLFNINGPIGYRKWSGYTADLSGTQLYSWLSDKSLAITNGSGVYGIPFAVETYGIIYNQALLNKYIALPGKAVNITKPEDINNFALLKAVAEDIQKNKDALGVKGAFASTSFAPGEGWRWYTHLLNLPIYYEYRERNVVDLEVIQFSFNENYRNVLDLYTNNSITEKTLLGSKTVEDSMTEFALEQVVFVQNGTWGAGQILSAPGVKVKESDIKFLPIYTGVPGEESQGLCTGSENFICVNKNASEADQAASIQFLEWLYGSDSGKKFVKDTLKFVTPFTTFGPSERPTDPLTVEAYRYLDNPNLTAVAWTFTTFPGEPEYRIPLGDQLVSYLLGKSSWADVSNWAVQNWPAAKNAAQ